MVKAETKSTQQKNKKKLWILATLVFLVIAVTVAWGVGAYISQIQYEKDRQRFVLVKNDIEALTAELNKVDENIQWESEATCRRSSVKYDEGVPTCEARTKSSIVVDNEVQVDEYIERYNNHFTDSSLFRVDGGYETVDATPNFPASLKPGAGGQDFWNDRANMRCSSLFIIDQDTEGRLEANFSCRGIASDTWFHVPTFKETSE